MNWGNFCLLKISNPLGLMSLSPVLSFYRVFVLDAQLAAAEQLLQHARKSTNVCNTAHALLEKAQALWVSRKAGKE